MLSTPWKPGLNPPRDQDFRILLVDDSPARKLALKCKLLRKGYFLMEASHGEEALFKLLRLAPPLLPDLIVSDVNMPVLNGIQLAEKIRAAPLLASIKIQLYTAVREEAQRNLQNLAAKDHQLLRCAVDFQNVEAAIENQLRSLRIERRMLWAKSQTLVQKAR